MAILTLLGPTDPIEGNEVAADVAGDEFDNTTTDSILHLYNQSGGDLRVQATEQRDCPYGDKNVHTSPIATVPAGRSLEFGAFNHLRYNNTFRRVEVTYLDGVTGLWVAARTRTGGGPSS